MSFTFLVGCLIFILLFLLTNVYVAIGMAIIYGYFIYKQRIKIFATSIALLVSGEKERVILNLSLTKLKNIVTSRGFADDDIEIENGFTFNIDNQIFIVSPVSRNKICMKLA